MAAKLLENMAAEQEANSVAARYMNSGDVLGDMRRDYGSRLDGVRLHGDGAAQARVQAAGRDAIASGQDVYFRSGILGSSDPAARGLVAHEMTHVMQQGQGSIIDWARNRG